MSNRSIRMPRPPFASRGTSTSSSPRSTNSAHSYDVSGMNGGRCQKLHFGFGHWLGARWSEFGGRSLRRRRAVFQSPTTVLRPPNAGPRAESNRFFSTSHYDWYRITQTPAYEGPPSTFRSDPHCRPSGPTTPNVIVARLDNRGSGTVNADRRLGARRRGR